MHPKNFIYLKYIFLLSSADHSSNTSSSADHSSLLRKKNYESFTDADSLMKKRMKRMVLLRRPLVHFLVEILKKINKG